jgi:hypothetical protein
MVDKAEQSATKHKATYARDKKKGGYLVRVSGPYPEKFAGRDVPVQMLDGTTHVEKLLKLIWTGIDTGEYGGKAGESVTLYTFESRPREPEGEVPF